MILFAVLEDIFFKIFRGRYPDPPFFWWVFHTPRPPLVVGGPTPHVEPRSPLTLNPALPSIAYRSEMDSEDESYTKSVKGTGQECIYVLLWGRGQTHCYQLYNK